MPLRRMVVRIGLLGIIMPRTILAAKIPSQIVGQGAGKICPSLKWCKGLEAVIGDIISWDESVSGLFEVHNV